MISMCGCYIISSYLWISTPPSPTPPRPCISARWTESLPWYYRRSRLVSWWNTRFAFIESQTCPCAQGGLVRTPESWMTSLGYFYTWRVDCRTMRQFPMIYGNDLIVALFLENGKWLGYNESTVGRLPRQLDCFVSWWWFISGHQLRYTTLCPQMDEWMDGCTILNDRCLLMKNCCICARTSSLAPWSRVLSAFPAPSSWTPFLFIVQ